MSSPEKPSAGRFSVSLEKVSLILGALFLATGAAEAIWGDKAFHDVGLAQGGAGLGFLVAGTVGLLRGRKTK